MGHQSRYHVVFAVEVAGRLLVAPWRDHRRVPGSLLRRVLAKNCPCEMMIDGMVSVSGSPAKYVTSSVSYDETAPPFLVMRLPIHQLGEDEFRTHLQDMDGFADRARGGPFGFVIDTRGAPDPEAPRRRAIAEYWDGCFRRHGNSFIGAAIVMSSSTGRAVFKAILWLRASSRLLAPVATPEDGLARLRAELRKMLRGAADPDI